MNAKDIFELGLSKFEIEFEVCDADPSVGIMHPYVEDYNILSMEGPATEVQEIVKNGVTEEQNEAILKMLDEWAMNPPEPEY